MMTKIVTSKPNKTAIRLSRLWDKPTQEIELFLDTFRNVPAKRKNPLPPSNESELYCFYKGWLPGLISEIGDGDNGGIIADCYIAFENLETNDFTSLLCGLPPKQFNGLTRSIAAI